MFLRRSRGISSAVVAVIVVVIIVVAGVAVYFVTTPSHVSTTSTTSSTSPSSTTSSTTSSSTSTSLPGPPNPNVLTISENEPPNSYDPASAAFVGEDEIVTNVYQPLLTFNYTSSTIYAPILASNWTSSPNSNVFTFTLRQDAYFMNNHPFNASVVWYNFYRDILMNQFGASFFVNLLYNGSQTSNTGVALPAGVSAALESAGYSFSSTNSTLAALEAGGALADILTNFNPSNSTVQKIMSFSGQSVVVLGTYEVQFNLLSPYLDFLEILAEPSSADGMVDPAFVSQNGGVQMNSENTYLNTHTMGTGPYTVQNYVTGSTITMVANPNYWAAKLPASQSNVMLTVPHIDTVIIDYATEATQSVEGIESNTVSLIEGWPIPALPPTYLPELAAAPGVQVIGLKNATSTVGFMDVLDTEQYPYNITNFRVALTHIINYTEILDTVASGYGEQYLGPITPGLPYYDPGNLPPYSYNTTLAISMLKSLGFELNLPNSTVINPGGAHPTLTLTYATGAPEQEKIGEEMQVMFANVGLSLSLNVITDQEESTVLFQSGTASSYPGMTLWYWNTYWPDPILQELVVQVDPYYGGSAGDTSWLNNATITALVDSLSSQTNPQQISSEVAKAYAMIYQQAPDIWLYSVVPYWIQRSYVSGVIYNPGLLGFYYPLINYDGSPY
jgi:peptide/nickel transport system substrate-binding protein